MITAEVEVTQDDKHFRVIRIPITAVNQSEGNRALREARKQMKKDEYVYQICAPCKGCELTQPFYDFFNGFHLLEWDIWGNQEVE